MEMTNTLVVGIGLGTVFAGLISIILLCYIMSAVCKLFAKPEQKAEKTVAKLNTAAPAPIENKQELVAACCAVIAEEIGTEAQNIRVLSFKRV